MRFLQPPVLYAGTRMSGSGVTLLESTTSHAVWHAQGLNIMAFCKEYNAATQDKVGTVIPVEITCFEVRCMALVMPLGRGVQGPV